MASRRKSNSKRVLSELSTTHTTAPANNFGPAAAGELGRRTRKTNEYLEAELQAQARSADLEKEDQQVRLFFSLFFAEPVSFAC